MGFGKDGMGVIIMQDISQAVLTLAEDTGLFISSALAILERFRMLKTQVYCTLTDVAAGELGGLELYLVDGDLSLVEAEEAIEQNGPVGPNDTILDAIALRAVFRVGAVGNSPGAQAREGLHMVNEKGGPLLSINPRWTFARTKGWRWMLYNNGPAPTTGTIAKINAKNFGVWVL